jgi:Tfp pilus assembly protein PilF/ribonuclease BN (tRNA processing enzyme)
MKSDKSAMNLRSGLPKSGSDWSILGSKLRAQGKLDEAFRAFSNALKDPHYKTPTIALNNIGLVLQKKGDLGGAIQAYRKALSNSNHDIEAQVWNNLGIALRENGDLDGSIDAHRKAIAAPKNKNRGRAWNNLGTTLRVKGKLAEAIKAHNRALADPAYDTPGKAWNNLAFALQAKGQFDESIKALKKALSDPKIGQPGYVWNNLGLAYRHKGQISDAIKAFRTALADSTYENPAKAWTNLGQVYAVKGDINRAKTAFQKALKSKDRLGTDHARARFGLQLLKSKIAQSALSPNDQALATAAPTEDIESAIITAITEAGVTQYDKYISHKDSLRDNVLSVLRGWSSAVPLLEGSERRWRGGGYFLKWKGCGVVLDPGFDFLRNFHDAGYHGREIQAVFVSHNHPDHNSDLKSIDDLQYELYKRLKTKGARPYVLLWDEDSRVATKFSIEKPEHQHPPIFLDFGFPQPIDLRKHPEKLPIRVIPFTVKHGVDVPHAMGMVIELLDEKGVTALRIGYTGDTTFFNELIIHLSKCDLLLAHISEPSVEELKDATKFKEGHLGYRGTAKLIKECKPKLSLIGEFWAGYTDSRISLVKGIRQRSGSQSVLPTGIAMHVHLPTLDIECTECGKPTPFAQIKVAPPTDIFGNLSYLCPKCLLH